MELPSIKELYQYNGVISEHHLEIHIRKTCIKITNEFNEHCKNVIISHCGEKTDLLRLYDMFSLSIDRHNTFYNAMIVFKPILVLDIMNMNTENKTEEYFEKIIIKLLLEFKFEEKIQQYKN